MTYSSQFSKSRHNQINATAAAMLAVGNFIVLENKLSEVTVQSVVHCSKAGLILHYFTHMLVSLV